MFEKLYSIKLPLDKRRQELYINGKSLCIEGDAVFLKKNQMLNFATYFNKLINSKIKSNTLFNIHDKIIVNLWKRFGVRGVFFMKYCSMVKKSLKEI